ncbi:hypothetical protein AMTRI_Chr02g265310 [Amborella trichopoda]
MLAGMWLKFKGEVRIVEEVVAPNPPTRRPWDIKLFDHNHCVVLECPGPRRHQKEKGVEILSFCFQT